MVIFYKKWKKYYEIQLIKNKMDLNNRKMTNHPPSPHFRLIIVCFAVVAYHPETRGIPLHDAVGVNCENGSATENKGAGA